MTFPDRLESIKQYIRDGGGLMMLGGWLSFSGAREMGGWRRSTLAGGDPYTANGHCAFDLIEWEVHQIMGIGPFTARGLEAAH